VALRYDRSQCGCFSLAVPPGIGHIDSVNRLALLLLLLSGLIGPAHAAPDVGLYDAIGRPIALPAVNLPGSVTRTAAGLLTTVTIGDLDTTFTYNAHGEVLTETTTDGQGVVFARAYTRDALGRITAVEETEGASLRKRFWNSCPNHAGHCGQGARFDSL
jgi:YD repeat-containing protein